MIEIDGPNTGLSDKEIVVTGITMLNPRRCKPLRIEDASEMKSIGSSQ